MQAQITESHFIDQITKSATEIDIWIYDPTKICWLNDCEDKNTLLIWKRYCQTF